MAETFRLNQGALGNVPAGTVSFQIPSEGEVFKSGGSNTLMYMKGGQIYQAPTGTLTMDEKRALGGYPRAIELAETKKFLDKSGIDYGGNVENFMSGLRSQNVGDLQTAGLVKVQNQQMQIGTSTPAAFKNVVDNFSDTTGFTPGGGTGGGGGTTGGGTTGGGTGGTTGTDEAAGAISEAESYFGYTLPTGETAPYQYPQMLQELKDAAQLQKTRAQEDLAFQGDLINGQRQKLLLNYNQYLEDIQQNRVMAGESQALENARIMAQQKSYLNTFEISMQQIANQRADLAASYDYQIEEIEMGRMQLGESRQLALAQAAEQRNLYLEEWQAQTSQGVEEMQKTWIQKGGLFSGPRIEAVGKFIEGSDRAKERYETSYQQTTDKQELSYKQNIEGLGLQEGRAGEVLASGQRGLSLSAQRLEAQKEGQLTDIGLRQQASDLSYQQQLAKYSQAQGQAGAQLSFNQSQLATQQARDEQSTARRVEDIGLQEIQSIRSLQEIYQGAIAERAAGTLEEQYV